MTLAASRRSVLSLLAATPFASLSGLPAFAQGGPIRIGELNSYGRMAVFAVPYRNALQMAIDEVNAKGGIKALSGRPIEMIFRDDGSTPGDAVRVAEDFIARDNVAFIAGTFLSNVGLAVADLANQKKVMFMATEPLTDALTLAGGNRYTFRIRPSTYMQTKMLVEAVKAKGIKRWAVVAPNYEYGQSAVANFKKMMAAAVPGFEVVGEQFPALGKIDAGATVGALMQSKPDAIFNVLFGADLAPFVREGQVRGLFEGKLVASLITGEPEYLLPLKDETPQGWIVTGYPFSAIDTPAHKAFADSYKAKFGEAPKMGSLLGYVVGQMIGQLLEKAASLETDKLIATFEDMVFDTVVGPVTMRGLDHQATMGAWVGETGLDNGIGVMKNWRYEDGAKFLVPEADVKAVRKW